MPTGPPENLGCLTDGTLAGLMDGSIDEGSLTRIAAHIDGCSACRHIVAEAGRGMEVRPATSGAPAGRDGPEAEWDLLPNGTAVGRYVIVECVGAGAMGVVYMAKDPELDRKVALKLLRSDGSPRPDDRTPLLREAQAMARLSHPNVIAIYDVGTMGDRVFLAMELVRGTLGDWLRDRPRTWREVADVFRAAGEGLAAAHDAGLVHRDFKPDNVLVAADGRVRVTDFGLAREADGAANEGDAGDGSAGTIASTALVRSLSHSTTFAGTPAYMAPEQLARRRADARSDVFAFCVAFYEALYGERPFEGVLRGRVRPPPPKSRVPTWLRRIVVQGLHVERKSRPETMRALLCLLDRGRSRARWQKTLYAISAAVLVGTLAVPALGLRARRLPTADTPQPGPSPLTDVPLPASTNPEALQAYKSGLDGLRDGRVTAASDFARAAELDPTLAAAHLRHALIEFSIHPLPAREHLAKATEGRHNLSPRDEVLLVAAQAWMQREPPDESGYARAMDAAVSRYSLDAEIAYWASAAHHVAGDGARALALAEQALQLDPTFTGAYFFEIEELFLADEVAKAEDAIRQCARHAPNPLTCLLEQHGVDTVDGNCARIADTSRQLLALDPGYYPLYWFEASAAYALGRPPEAVSAFLSQYVAHAPPENQPGLDLVYGTAPEVLLGHFAVADERGRDLEQRIVSVADSRWHVAAALWRMDVALETGRRADAGQIAQQFLRGKDAWITEERSDELALSRDPTPVLLLAERRAGLITPEDFEAQRGAWADRWAAKLPRPLRSLVWLQAFAAVAETTEDANRALAEQPKYGRLRRYVSYVFPDAYLGTTLLLAGKTADAVTPLRRAAQSCRAIDGPFVHTQVHLRLGQALAAEGQKDDACAAYGVVLARWGHASPPSVTAGKARALARELGCSPIP